MLLVIQLMRHARKLTGEHLAHTCVAILTSNFILAHGLLHALMESIGNILTGLEFVFAIDDSTLCFLVMMKNAFLFLRRVAIDLHDSRIAKAITFIVGCTQRLGSMMVRGGSVIMKSLEFAVPKGEAALRHQRLR